jgi:hypothetical protein
VIEGHDGVISLVISFSDINEFDEMISQHDKKSREFICLLFLYKGRKGGLSTQKQAFDALWR